MVVNTTEEGCFSILANEFDEQMFNIVNKAGNKSEAAFELAVGLADRDG